MASALTRSKPNRRSRKLSGERRPLQKPVPVEIVSVTPSGVDATIVFNQPVSLKGIPQYLKNGTIAPTGATLTAPNTLLLTYPALSPAVTSINVPAEDPSVRNTSGGFVTPSSVAA